MTPSSNAVSDTADAVIIGAGHNGSVAAALLADAGWDVIVLEAQNEPGGAVKSAELVPGYISDLYSSFYPLGAASPILRALDLDQYGLRWTHAPTVLTFAAAFGLIFAGLAAAARRRLGRRTVSAAS